MVVLKKKSIGLDISDRTIEVVELTDEGGKKAVSSMGREMLQEGIVERGRINDHVQLAGALDKVFKQSRPHPITTRKVTFGLPESQVYTHIFELPPHALSDRDALVEKEAQTSIPLIEGDMLTSYSVLWEEEGKVEILLVAMNRSVFLEWYNFFRDNKIEVENYDIETLATFRGLFAKRPKLPISIVDIGARTTSIAIFSSKGLRYSYTLEVSGNTMTDEIAQDMHVGKEKAEELKVQIGLANKKEQIFFILVKILQQIVESVRASLSYYKERTGESVDRVLLVGGGSKLKGIVQYFKEELMVPTWLGEAILLHNVGSLEYIEAIGLALRGLDKTWQEADPVFYVKQPGRLLSTTREKTGKGASEEEEKEENELQLASPIELREIKKLQFEKKMLLGVLIIGIVLLIIAAWYRSYAREGHLRKLPESRQDVPSIGLNR